MLELKYLKKLGVDERIAEINRIKLALHELSPLKHEPVDCVLWVKGEQVAANEYNPNAVAPPEMELLRISITSDGYTQPIVAFKEGEENYTVVDGFHRSRVGKECEDVRERVKGYLPITVIRADREDKGDRIAATIRHNRARGKHRVDAMSEIVLELKRRNWSDKKIGHQLGMDPDEVLRLAQITGIAEMFADKEFSEAWEGISVNEDDNLNVEQEAEPDSLYPVEVKARIRAIAIALLENLNSAPVGLFNLLNRLQLPIEDKEIVVALLSRFREKGRVAFIRTVAGKRRYKLKGKIDD